MDTLTIFNFSWYWLLFMGGCSLFGVILRELWVWSRNEKEYNVEDRKGDFILSVIGAPGTTVLVLPFAFDYFDINSFYNYGVMVIYGFLFLRVVEYVDKKAKQKIEE